MQLPLSRNQYHVNPGLDPCRNKETVPINQSGRDCMKRTISESQGPKLLDICQNHITYPIHAFGAHLDFKTERAIPCYNFRKHINVNVM